MKKIVLALFVLALSFGATGINKTFAAQKKVSYSQSSIAPAIQKYRAQNYIGAMQDLQEVLKKEPNNTYAKYYLALSYTQLGIKEKAQELYRDIIENSKQPSLVYYSQRALDCIGNSSNPKCKPAGTNETLDDITKFIQSGQKIHPAAMDRIINEKMERELERSEYEKKLNPNAKSDNSVPTNEEIAQALNVLSKAGINPYTPNPYIGLMNNNIGLLNNQNSYNPYLYSALMQNSNPETSKMMLYAQMMGSNNLLNYGI